MPTRVSPLINSVLKNLRRTSSFYNNVETIWVVGLDLLELSLRVAS